MPPNISRTLLLGSTAFLTASTVLVMVWRWHKKAKRHKSLYEWMKAIAKESLSKSSITTITSFSEWEEYGISDIDLDNIKALGLDCEWITKEKKRQPISMLQLSTWNKTILVRLHILYKENGIPSSLRRILLDKSILKFGVGIMEDKDKMLLDYGVDVKGCVDLRHLACRYRKAWSGLGLKRLAEEIAEISLDKSDSLRRGDWEAECLSRSMEAYAARDSQAGLAIFLCLVALKLSNIDQSPLTTEKLFELVRNRIPALCHGIVDQPYKLNLIKKSASDGNVLKVPSDQSNITKAVSSNALRSKVMYSNCFMEAPDGQVLCVCDAKKALWYCDKDLADLVSGENDENMVIRLRFEPRGRPSGERDYYRSKKENICVVCGADQSFIRKNIVPREYRKHFPEILKSHSSHDVVLLCATCHRKSSIHDQEYKEHFAKTCNAPYKPGGMTVDEDLRRVKSAARALSGYYDRLPADKREEYKKTVVSYFGADDVSDDLLKIACDVDERVCSNEMPSHGFKVVQCMAKEGKLQDFEKLWRQRFVDTMQPKFLHKLWRVEYDHLKMSA